MIWECQNMFCKLKNVLNANFGTKFKKETGTEIVCLTFWNEKEQNKQMNQ